MKKKKKIHRKTRCWYNIFICVTFYHVFSIFFFTFLYATHRMTYRIKCQEENRNGGREGRENRKERRRDDEAGTNGLRQLLTRKYMTLFFLKFLRSFWKTSSFAEMHEKFPIQHLNKRLGYRTKMHLRFTVSYKCFEGQAFRIIAVLINNKL